MNTHKRRCCPRIDVTASFPDHLQILSFDLLREIMDFYDWDSNRLRPWIYFALNSRLPTRVVEVGRLVCYPEHTDRFDESILTQRACFKSSPRDFMRSLYGIFTNDITRTPFLIQRCLRVVLELRDATESIICNHDDDYFGHSTVSCSPLEASPRIDLARFFPSHGLRSLTLRFFWDDHHELVDGGGYPCWYRCSYPKVAPLVDFSGLWSRNIESIDLPPSFNLWSLRSVRGGSSGSFSQCRFVMIRSENGSCHREEEDEEEETSGLGAEISAVFSSAVVFRIGLNGLVSPEFIRSLRLPNCRVLNAVESPSSFPAESLRAHDGFPSLVNVSIPWFRPDYFPALRSLGNLRKLKIQDRMKGPIPTRGPWPILHLLKHVVSFLDRNISLRLIEIPLDGLEDPQVSVVSGLFDGFANSVLESVSVVYFRSGPFVDEFVRCLLEHVKTHLRSFSMSSYCRRFTLIARPLHRGIFRLGVFSEHSGAGENVLRLLAEEKFPHLHFLSCCVEGQIFPRWFVETIALKPNLRHVELSVAHDVNWRWRLRQLLRSTSITHFSVILKRGFSDTHKLKRCIESRHLRILDLPNLEYCGDFVDTRRRPALEIVHFENMLINPLLQFVERSANYVGTPVRDDDAFNADIRISQMVGELPESPDPFLLEAIRRWKLVPPYDVGTVDWKSYCEERGRIETEVLNSDSDEDERVVDSDWRTALHWTFCKRLKRQFVNLMPSDLLDQVAKSWSVIHARELACGVDLVFRVYSVFGCGKYVDFPFYTWRRDRRRYDHRLSIFACHTEKPSAEEGDRFSRTSTSKDYETEEVLFFQDPNREVGGSLSILRMIEKRIFGCHIFRSDADLVRFVISLAVGFYQDNVLSLIFRWYRGHLNLVVSEEDDDDDEYLSESGSEDDTY